MTAFDQRFARLVFEPTDLLAGALAHLLLQREPTAERLLLLERRAPELRVPCKRLDVTRGRVLQLLARACELRHELLEIDGVEGGERLLVKPVRDRVLDAARRCPGVIWRLALCDGRCPRRRRRFEPREQLAPTSRIADEALDLA